jgi:hypothetical protein
MEFAETHHEWNTIRQTNRERPKGRNREIQAEQKSLNEWQISSTLFRDFALSSFRDVL